MPAAATRAISGERTMRSRGLMPRMSSTIEVALVSAWLRPSPAWDRLSPDRCHDLSQPSRLAVVSLSPFRGHLVTDSEQEEDDDEAQWHAEQPEQNEDHGRSPFRLLAARESDASPIVG
jgi:hypothetical protein